MGRSGLTDPPKFFYKYMTAETAKIVLVTRQLRWSSPLLFNDPFDVTQELRLNFDEGQLNAALVERLALLVEQGNPSVSVKDLLLTKLLRGAIGASPEVRRKIAYELRQIITTPASEQTQAFKIVKETWREMVPTFRVLCLSELNDVTPMWLHYADRYRGIVLEFSSVDIESAFLVARPVVYQDTAPAIADVNEWVSCMLGQRKYRDLFTEYQYVKTSEWANEKEWRIVSGARTGETELFGDYGFHLNDLSGIYFGEKCSGDDRRDLMVLLAHGLEHVRAYEAFSDSQQAKFVFRTV